jgi:hypothetical protein
VATTIGIVLVLIVAVLAYIGTLPESFRIERRVPRSARERGSPTRQVISPIRRAEDSTKIGVRQLFHQIPGHDRTTGPFPKMVKQYLTPIFVTSFLKRVERSSTRPTETRAHWRTLSWFTGKVSDKVGAFGELGWLRVVDFAVPRGGVRPCRRTDLQSCNVAP